MKVIQIDGESSDESLRGVRIIKVNDTSESGGNKSIPPQNSLRSSLSGPMQVIDEKEDTPEKSTPSNSRIQDQDMNNSQHMITIEEDVTKENLVSPITTPKSKPKNQE